MDTLLDISDVAQKNRRTVSVSRHNQIAISFRLIDLAVRKKNKCPVRSVELACPGIDGAGFDGGRQIVHGQAAGCQRGRIGLNPNRSLDPVDADLRHAG